MWRARAGWLNHLYSLVRIFPAWNGLQFNFEECRHDRFQLSVPSASSPAVDIRLLPSEGASGQCPVVLFLHSIDSFSLQSLCWSFSCARQDFADSPCVKSLSQADPSPPADLSLFYFVSVSASQGEATGKS